MGSSLTGESEGKGRVGRRARYGQGYGFLFRGFSTPIVHDGNQTSQTREVFVNCRSVSGWRGAPRRRLTACRDRPHARAPHACEEGSHCFTITSTGRRASSVRSLSTEQRVAHTQPLRASVCCRACHAHLPRASSHVPCESVAVSASHSRQNWYVCV